MKFQKIIMLITFVAASTLVIMSHSNFIKYRMGGSSSMIPDSAVYSAIHNSTFNLYGISEGHGGLQYIMNMGIRMNTFFPVFSSGSLGTSYYILLASFAVSVPVVILFFWLIAVIIELFRKKS